jgi:replication factor A1
MPISALNSFSMDWRIKARVINLPPIRTYKNAKGEGQILSLDLIDKDGTMI